MFVENNVGSCFELFVHLTQCPPVLHIILLR